MAAPRMLRDDPAEDVLSDLLFTESALAADPDAADFAPVITPHIDGWEVVTRALRAATRIEIKTEALAALRDADLDDAVIRFSDDLLRAVGKSSDDPRFRRYFKQSPSRFIRNARLEEAATVKSWISSIKVEPEPEVSRHAELLAKAAQASAEALEGTATAAGERASLRVRDWGSYIRGVDATRDALYADLVKRGQEKKKPRDWAGRFFRTRGRTSKGSTDSGSDGEGAGTPL